MAEPDFDHMGHAQVRRRADAGDPAARAYLDRMAARVSPTLSEFAALTESDAAARFRAVMDPRPFAERIASTPLIDPSIMDEIVEDQARREADREAATERERQTLELARRADARSRRMLWLGAGTALTSVAALIVAIVG